MEYKKQELVAWGLSGQFETIENFQITKPSWKNSFWENFFLSSIDSLVAANITQTNVLWVYDVNWTEVVLSNNTGAELNVSIAWTTVYTWVKWVSEKAIVLRWGYDVLLSGTITSVIEEDPTKDANDVFWFGYMKLWLSVTPSVGDYITFTSNTTNLQGITTEVHYIQGGFAYVRGTNLYWTLPTVGETVTIHDKIGDVLIIGETDSVKAIDSAWNAITLYTCKTDDSIVDIEYYNGTLFILTKNFVFYGRSLVNCNMNVYPLDFFDNMTGWDRILWFGKHLIMFGRQNQIISPVNGTAGSLWYVANWLNFNHSLYSKYSALTDQWSLYILQDDKEFVKVDIISVANGEYDLQTTDAMPEARWLLSDITWDVFITKGDKYISIVNNHWDSTTTAYSYNLSYQHWVTWEFPHWLRSIWDDIFWDTQFTKGTWDVSQELSFSLWGDTLSNMKTCYFVKMILVVETDVVPDYTLTVDKFIAGKKFTKTVDLKDYPINIDINWLWGWMWYQTFWEDPLAWAEVSESLGYIINVQVRINETADMFVFTLKNKTWNKITYGGNVIGYKSWLPEVTAYNYTIK